VTYLAREYVWGPGDSWGWGVDELLAQYDADRRASWPLQDAGGDVIALCDRGGANGTARVIAQVVYDAHGAVIDRDDPYGLTASTGKELRVGHKGLFFDRLDAGISDPVTGQETPRLWPGARLSGYARNRTLHCGFGRWNQPDPNMTGLPVQQAFVFHGSGLRCSIQRFDLRRHYGSGPNSYQYLLANSMYWSDPLGLIEFSLAGLLKATFTRQALASGTISGIYGAISGGASAAGRGNNVALGAAKGAIAGFVGGLIGYHAGAALAFTGNAPLIMTVEGIAGGGVGGGFSSLLSGDSPREIGKSVLQGAMIGGFAGLIGSAGWAKAVANDRSGSERAAAMEMLDLLYGEMWQHAGGAVAGGLGAGFDQLR
jgi:hypothetical protein